MTASEWLKYEAERTGKTVEEVREIMRARGAKADPKKRGLASAQSITRIKVAKMGGLKSRKNNGKDKA